MLEGPVEDWLDLFEETPVQAGVPSATSTSARGLVILRSETVEQARRSEIVG
jgi:hypothetical protein